MFLSDKYHSGNQQFSTGGKCERRWKTILPSMPVYAAVWFGCLAAMLAGTSGIH